MIFEGSGDEWQSDLLFWDNLICLASAHSFKKNDISNNWIVEKYLILMRKKKCINLYAIKV